MKLNWHRLLGLALTDYFTNTCYKVEMEVDLSLQQQFLDIVIIKQTKGKPPEELPDGFENLSTYNLLTYKSLREPLDSWAMSELLGHFVNYRKQISPDNNKLLPLEHFNLYAVSTRYPRKLEEEITLKKQQDGLYLTQWGAFTIEVLVLTEMPIEKQNALWQLFSGDRDKVFFGKEHFAWHEEQTSSVIDQLFERYQVEGIFMPYTMADFQREYKQELLQSLTPEEIFRQFKPEERLKGLTPEERLQGLGPEERLQGLGPEERLQGLEPEERLQGLGPEERLQGLTPEEIEAYLEKLKKSGSEANNGVKH